MSFIDVEQVLIVEGDTLVWTTPGSFNLHLARSGHIQLARARVILQIWPGRQAVGGRWWRRKAWASSSQQRVVVMERLVLRLEAGRTGWWGPPAEWTA